MAIINFNAAQVEPQSSFEPIPSDWYNVMIDESEMKPTKDGGGAYLECRLSILDGPYANRKLYIRLNLQNANATAVNIAYGQLSAICHATGVIQVADSHELHGKPFGAKVVVRPPKGEYDASNEVKAFRACSGAVSGASSPGGSAAGSGAATGATPAWVQKKAAQADPDETVTIDQAVIDAAVEAAVEAEAAQAKAEAAAKAKAAKKAELLRQLAEADEDEIEDAVITPSAAQATVEETPAQPHAAASGKPPWMK
jgi:hypothetical protein